MIKSSEITVSVCMITYKHEEFLDMAIKGVLSQKANFKIELIISDDASPDKSEAIVKKYLNSSNESIQVLYFKHPKNIGAIPNFHWTLKQCSGRFIALCEGDDYWINPHKLQKQYDFLIKNLNCSFVFHKAFILSDNSENKVFPSIKNRILSAKEFLENPTIPTCSVFFRKFLFDVFETINHSHGDFLLYCFLLEKGNAGFIDETMSVYRKHSAGISFFKDFRYLKNRISELKKELRYFQESSLKEGIKNQIGIHQYTFYKKYRSELDFLEKTKLTIELIFNPWFIKTVILKKSTGK